MTTAETSIASSHLLSSLAVHSAQSPSMPPKPARETGATHKEASQAPETPSSKRKRRPSADIPLKVVLPSPSSLALTTSPTKANGNTTAEHETKRPRLSFRLHPSKDQEMTSKALRQDIRHALSTVIARFAEKEENTLGYILNQATLTWEQLADTLHLFSENLLVPCQYPNPVPTRSQFHVSLPPLPSHLRPHGIYNFCVSLYSLLSDIEPKAGDQGLKAERWALMQKTPQAGEWFTNSVDMREAAKKGDAYTLEALAKGGDTFGHASGVSLQSGLISNPQKVPTLSETVIRRASLKINRWKEKRALQQAGGFGSVPRGVTIPLTAPVLFTPSFAPSFDSTFTTGGEGYFSTLEGMHERARHREWAKRILRKSRHIEEGGYFGSIDDYKGKEKETVDDILSGNGEMLEELQAWQQIRARKGASSVTEREQKVAEQLLSSLTELTGHITPAQMISTSTSKVGLAHELARRLLPVSSPNIRGTLDPRRPHALHDNTTVKLRPATVQAPGVLSNMATASPHAPPPTKMPPPPIPPYSAPPPHTLPNARYPYNEHRHSPAPVYPYNSSGTNQTRPTTASPPIASPGPSSAIFPRSAGPSNLRQSFGPQPHSPSPNL